VSVREARRILTQEEAHKLIDFDTVVETALQRTQEHGVVFLDELDKIAGPAVETGPDVSGEGVQRDLLPIVEGSTVQTRYGTVKTDHILFIAAGAFHQVRPGDLIPELQGRFPLRVELASLSQEDLIAILTQPENALTKQYTALLGTEQVTLEFAADGLERIGEVATLMNERNEDIGARRLHTIMEQVLEELSFEADDHQGETVCVDRAFVDARLGELVEDEDLSRFIL
jgi:ATP-dependent HslUV protease ATP-binding subunit HslU